ncbi:MAG: fibronectin type III domain-containing protein [Tepidisphaeraceae bacterium]
MAEPLERRTLMASTLVITAGGTYSGTWESQDPMTPVVSVQTNEPVVIVNSVIRGPGDLIASGVDHTDITVRNTQGYGVNPNLYGRATGEFISVRRFDNLVAEDNYFEHTAGINLLDYLGTHTAADTVRVVDNHARNIDGRESDGNGGYLDFNARTRRSDGITEKGYEIVQFVQLDKVSGVPGMQIAWNKVINEPGNSRVEDNINIYKSGGTIDSPLLIHDNYIEGAYTIAPWQGDYSDDTYDYGWGFSGGGILLGDGVGSDTTADPAYVQAYGNTIVSTTNFGIAIAAGHDMEFYDNRIVSAGVLPDGRAITAQNVGAYIWDAYGAGATHFYDNYAHDNLIGWVKGSGRNDWWSPVAGALYNNTRWLDPITAETESAEYALWQQKLAEHQPPTTTPPAAPSDLAAITAGTNQINLTWTDNADNEGGFRIERSPDGEAGWTTVATLGRNMTRYSDANELSSGTTYHYRVVAINIIGDSDASNVAGATTLIPIAPTAPANLAASVMTSTRIDLTWTDTSNNETGFIVERSPDGPAGWTALTTLSRNTTSYSDVGLTPATSYSYRVRATNAVGDSPDSNVVAATTFDPALPAPWSNGDIGTTGAAGSAGANNGAFTIRGAGSNIGGSADAFHFVYQTLTGNGTLIARVTGVQNTASGAKAGIDMRDGLSRKARHAGLFLTPSGGVKFVRRTKTGGSSSTTTASGPVAPYWLKLVRSGNTFSAYRSPDGTTWTKVGSASVSMGATIYVGLAVTSSQSGVLNSSTFDNVSLT